MRILIAEDESIIRMGLKAMLVEMGHEVVTAVNGREALDMARHHQPELAVLDIKMPFTNGLQVAETLARTQPIPILMLTAFSDQSLIEEASNLPIHGYLIKPTKPEELAAAIAVARKRFADNQALSEKASQLEETLETRKIIDRAKGKLMEKGLTEEDAYHLIQTQARSLNKSMKLVALAILKD
jgi:response regulator NasT